MPHSTYPLVSLVTPTYNQAEYLEATIESVLAQGYPALDYHVIDDGSSDATAQVLERYRGRLRITRQENRGQSRTLNRGWEEAEGAYIGYLSSDDLLKPNAIERLVEALERSPGVVCAFPDCDVIDDRGKVIRRNVVRPFDLVETVVSQGCFIGPGAFFRRDAFLKVGGWRADLRLNNDREFWMRLADHGSFLMLPEVLALYRRNLGSASYRFASEEQSLEYVRVLDDYYARGVTPELEARKDEAYSNAYLLVARNCFRGGMWKSGFRHWATARRLQPALGSVATAYSLARTAVAMRLRLARASLRRAA